MSICKCGLSFNLNCVARFCQCQIVILKMKSKYRLIALPENHHVNFFPVVCG